MSKTYAGTQFDVVDAIVLVALALTPFYFLRPYGVNISLADVFFTGAIVAMVFRRRRFILFSSPRIGFGVLLFLLGAAISLLVTPRPLEGLLDFFQYALIFIVVVPVTITVFRDRQRCWVALLLLWIGLNLFTVVASYRAVVVATTQTSPFNALKHMQLWYGNQNLLYWSISAAAITNLVLALDEHVSRPIRYASFSLVFPSIGLVLVGQSLSAILMAITAYWLAVLLWVYKTRTQQTLWAYFGLTLIATGVGLTVVVTHLEYLLWLGNVNDRLIMYRIALRLGTQAFPFGTGLESSPVVVAPISVSRTGVSSIHNAVLAYYLETGILGATGFIAIVVYWLRDVALAHLRLLSDLHFYEIGPMLIFGSYLIVILFQNVPVQRFWWVIFALSCATIIDVD